MFLKPFSQRCSLIFFWVVFCVHKNLNLVWWSAGALWDNLSNPPAWVDHLKFLFGITQGLLRNLPPQSYYIQSHQWWHVEGESPCFFLRVFAQRKMHIALSKIGTDSISNDNNHCTKCVFCFLLNILHSYFFQILSFMNRNPK